jgi:hypothetical protein
MLERIVTQSLFDVSRAMLGYTHTQKIDKIKLFFSLIILKFFPAPPALTSS